MRSFSIVRSVQKTVIAAAALFAAMAILPTSANANAVDRLKPTTAATNNIELIQLASISAEQARAARRSIREDLREPCRAETDRRDRRRCFRDARREWRDYRREARRTYRDCRRNDGTRRDCRQERREYWVNQANGGGDATDPGDPGHDRGED